MTKPRYLHGCAAGSKVRGVASPDYSGYAWNVNLNHGNSNINNRNNDGCVLVCRPASPRESQGAQGITFRHLHTAWRSARRRKRLSANQLRFESRLEDNLIQLEYELNTGTWHPRPTTLFVADAPKAREIHAPDFADRVVHHVVVPPLEAEYEPKFICDSYANRVGKGTHAAVTRLEGFVRQVASGQGGGFFLQLDIKNFFNSIPRETLWQLIKPVMVKADLPEAHQRAVHALLRRSPLEYGVIHRASPAERALVPLHKRLENARQGCGIPIGNLSSQFFANVLLNELDQFVKHVLKVPRYLRYVDDFVLVHESREQLAAWRDAIEDFLRDRLQLELKADQRLQPLDAGIDFLGYVVRPTHTRVRTRVVHHLEQKLWSWQQRHVQGQTITATPEQLGELANVTASYQGHFSHADSFHLRQSIHRRHRWLHSATSVRRRFDHRAEQRPITIKVYP